MRPREIFALWLGALGIFVLDLGFSGSSMTDIFYFAPPVQGLVKAVNSTVPPIKIPPAPTNFLGNLMPGGNIALLLIGAVLLGVAMTILILLNRNAGKVAT